MTWHRITFTLVETATGAAARLMNEFGLLFITAGAPKGAGLFSARGVTGNHFYLSPQAGRIASSLLRRYRATECSAPNPSSLRSIIGHSDDTSNRDSVSSDLSQNLALAVEIPAAR